MITLAIFAGFAAFAGNRLYCEFLLAFERWLRENGQIPARGQVRYLSDFHFFTKGDKWFLGGMDSAIAVVLVNGGMPPWPVTLFAALFTAGYTWFWHWRWLRRKANFDSMYYEPGKVSGLGIAHLPYFYAQYFLGLVGLSALIANFSDLYAFAVIWGICGVLMAVGYFWSLLWKDRDKLVW